MKIFALFVILTFAACGAQTENASPLEQAALKNAGGLRGYVAVNEFLETQLFRERGHLALAYYLDDRDSPEEVFLPENAKPLTKILGFYAGTGPQGAWINIAPNAVNSLLWLLLTHSFSHDLSQLCGKESRLEPTPAFKYENIKQDFVATLLNVCSSKESFAASDWETLWDQLIFLEAGEEEKVAWLAFVQKESAQQKDAAALLETALTAALYHPEILLRN